MKLFPVGLTAIDYTHLVKILMQYDKNPTFQLDVNNVQLNTLDSFIFLIDTFGSKTKQSMPEILKFSDSTLELLSLTMFHDLSQDLTDIVKRTTQLAFRNIFIPGRTLDQDVSFGFITGSLYQWRRATYTALRDRDIDELRLRFYNHVLRIFDSLKLDKIFATFERKNHPVYPGEIYFK